MKRFKAVVLQDMDEDLLELRVDVAGEYVLLSIRALDSNPVKEKMIRVPRKSLLEAISSLDEEGEENWI